MYLTNSVTDTSKTCSVTHGSKVARSINHSYPAHSAMTCRTPSACKTSLMCNPVVLTLIRPPPVCSFFFSVIMFWVYVNDICGVSFNLLSQNFSDFDLDVVRSFPHIS